MAKFIVITAQRCLQRSLIPSAVDYNTAGTLTTTARHLGPVASPRCLGAAWTPVRGLLDSRRVFGQHGQHGQHDHPFPGLVR